MSDRIGELDKLLDYEPFLPPQLRPYCAHTDAQLIEEIIDITDTEKFHQRGVYCFDCQDWIQTLDRPEEGIDG